jgi:Zn-dependent peptidase ImmA (M78 family)
MSEQIPVTPALLTWARERAGLSKNDASEKFKNFKDWEQGSSYPTYPQLEQLAEVLKVPIAVFFFPEPPAVPPISETFRTLPNSEIEKLPSRIRMLLRKAKSLQLNLQELTQGRNPSTRLITKDLAFSSDTNISIMSGAVREYIGISLDQQKDWKDDETALKEWRSALLAVGIFVFKDAFKVEEYSGFCLYDDLFPIIYVNNSSTKTRQIFTYFHELAHLLFHTSGIDTLHDEYIKDLSINDKRVEILCNQFAAHFLMPEQEFVRALGRRDVSESTAEYLAATFHVSREVVFRRFLDQGRIQESQYKAAVARWNEQRQSGGGSGGDHYWTKLSYLGRDYVSLALSQFYQHRIDENQLADYLDTKPKNLSTLEEYFQRGSA